ncbi:hypothetical protein EJ08DRAFT_408083 [Tothia fuscella]|uniref:BTB domain-containing protein n=1 Tax=Tothia fuscella TaxID=1048955 RepID=A0A9P4NK94_9PEZI|nr:hypothetical protein EJ08DRAFT_408083 [Tothia fuscella]
MEHNSHIEEEMPTMQIRIDRNGDLILLAGLDKVQLLVSSKIMTLVLKVFTAMLKPNFMEGTAFTEHRNNSEIYQLPLPNDNSETLELLCNIIHHQTRHIPNDPNLVTISNLAMMADKYDCVDAIRWYAEHALKYRVNQKGITDEDVCILLVASYQLDSPEAFAVITQKLVRRAKSLMLDLPRLYSCLKDLPLEFMIELEHLRNKLWKDINNGLDVMTKIEIEDLTWRKYHSSKSEENPLFRLSILAELRHLKIWPPTVQDGNIDDTSEAVCYRCGSSKQTCPGRTRPSK